MGSEGIEGSGNGPEMRVRRGRGLAAVGPARRLDPSYSAVVRFLRIALPIVALALVALVAAWPYLQKENIAFTIGFVTSELTGDQQPVMVNPRYTGTDQQDRPYSITADLAHNLVQDTTRVDLDNPKADMTLEDGTWLVVTADKGVYARTEEILDLSGSVNLFQDEGYELKTESVRIDLDAGTAESTTPTEGQGPFGLLKAEGFRVLDLGKTILFTGNASLVLYPDSFGGGS
ncbi:MAG: LPS export ABC transporter periplasmic protein LptC [Rhodospirillales bacterium]